MKKKIILVGSIVVACVLVVLIAMFSKKIAGDDSEQIDSDDDAYVIEIPNADKVVKIQYYQINGDMYEITDGEVIKQFIKKANGTNFVKGRYLGASSWNSGGICLCDEEGNDIFVISILSDNSITYGDGPHEYTTTDGYGVELLEGQGTFIENTHIK